MHSVDWVQIIIGVKNKKKYYKNTQYKEYFQWRFKLDNNNSSIYSNFECRVNKNNCTSLII